MKKSDFILVAILLAAGLTGLIIFNNGNTGDYVNIYSNGQLYGSYPISESETVVITTPEGESNTVVIGNGCVYIEEASCSNQVCVNQGSISKDNETICCAPNRLIVSVEGAFEGDYDAITQ